jgi:hypothetical protein
LKHPVLTVPVPRCYRGTFIGTGIGTADFKNRYRTTGTAVDFESTASKPDKDIDDLERYFSESSLDSDDEDPPESKTQKA